MAVAAHVFDKQPAPPVLSRAWDYQTYGVNVLDLPAGELSALRLANNAHRALSGYRSAAGQTVQWSRQNPSAWIFVAHILELRLNERKAARAKVIEA